MPPAEEKQARLLSDEEIARIEAAHPRGLTSGQIMEIFNSRGIQLAEPTFRRYVQLGLVPRCRRVGSRGKHKGSHGIYPVETVRRINSTKRMVRGNVTLEQLRRSSARFDTEVETLMGSASRLIAEMKKELGSRNPRPALLNRLTAELGKSEQELQSFGQKLREAGDEISQLPIVWEDDETV